MATGAADWKRLDRQYESSISSSPRERSKGPSWVEFGMEGAGGGGGGSRVESRDRRNGSIGGPQFSALSLKFVLSASFRAARLLAN